MKWYDYFLLAAFYFIAVWRILFLMLGILCLLVWIIFKVCEKNPQIKREKNERREDIKKGFFFDDWETKVYVCSHCGYKTHVFLSKCPICGSRNTCKIYNREKRD